jgi:AraC-like DNA-binding protein
MFADLKLSSAYDGLLYLADTGRNLAYIQSHHHSELELNLVVDGAVTYLMNGRRFSFPPRTLLWIHPGQEHQMVTRTANARFYVVVFKPALIARSCKTEPYLGLKAQTGSNQDIPSCMLDPRSYELVRSVMETLSEGLLDADLLNREAGYGPRSNFRYEHKEPDMLNAGLHYLLLLCWTYQLSGKSNRMAVTLHPAVRRTLKLLSDGSTGMSLTDLAKACGTSKSYLSRIFHRQIGVPLVRYQISLRISKFFDLYRQDEHMTMLDAAFAAGFGSYAQFYKVFTKAYGRGPRQALICERNERRRHTKSKVKDSG